ncbi:hypothetical protein NDU88_000067, partial [Pleurodeles waltl]
LVSAAPAGLGLPAVDDLASALIPGEVLQDPVAAEEGSFCLQISVEIVLIRSRTSLVSAAPEGLGLREPDDLASALKKWRFSSKIVVSNSGEPWSRCRTSLVSADPEGLGLRAVDDPASALIPELWLYLETIQRSAPLENSLDLDKDGAATDIKQV